MQQPYGDDFDHILNDSLTCFDEKSEENPREDVWFGEGALKCHNDEAMKSKKRGSRGCLDRGNNTHQQ